MFSRDKLGLHSGSTSVRRPIQGSTDFIPRPLRLGEPPGPLNPRQERFLPWVGFEPPDFIGPGGGMALWGPQPFRAAPCPASDRNPGRGLMDEGLWAAAVQRVWRRRRGSPGHGTRPTDPAGRGPGPNVGPDGRGETLRHATVQDWRETVTRGRLRSLCVPFSLDAKPKSVQLLLCGPPSTTQMSQPTISKELAITSAVELEVSGVSASAT